MVMKGEKKKEYQREYMRKRRSNTQDVKKAEVVLGRIRKGEATVPLPEPKFCRHGLMFCVRCGDQPKM